MTMAAASATEAYKDLHEKEPYHDGTFTSWAAKRSREHPFYFDAGVTIAVADDDLNPWDDFTMKVDASPVRPVASDEGDAGE